MARHIGIVIGSAEMGALCYRLICSGSADLMGELNHPEISTHSIPLKRYINHGIKGDWEEVASLMLESARKLAGMGAEFLICPDNTLHRAFKIVAESSPLPWIHIAEPIRDRAIELGLSRLGLIGTKILLEGQVFSKILKPEGIEIVLPYEEETEFVDRLILDEITYGISTPESRKYFDSLIRGMKDNGCDGVIMASDASILIDNVNFTIPVLDSVRLLAEAAIRESLR